MHKNCIHVLCRTSPSSPRLLRLLLVPPVLEIHISHVQIVSIVQLFSRINKHSIQFHPNFCRHMIYFLFFFISQFHCLQHTPKHKFKKQNCRTKPSLDSTWQICRQNVVLHPSPPERWPTNSSKSTLPPPQKKRDRIQTMKFTPTYYVYSVSINNNKKTRVWL